MDTKLQRRSWGRLLGMLGVSALMIGGAAGAQAPIPLQGSPPTPTHDKDVLTGTVRANLIQPEQLLSQGKYADAEEMYRQVLMNDPQNLSATVGLGMALAKQFKLDGADDMFDRVLQSDLNNGVAHAGKATVALNRL